MSKIKSQSTLSNQIGSIISASDQQSENLASTELADEKFVKIFNEHFQKMDILKNATKIKVITTLSNTLKYEQKKQLDTIITIGRSFLKTEEAFSEEEWDHLLAGSQKLFGMKKNMVSMYRSVARDVDNGRIPREICPPSFSTAYQVTTFTDQQLQKALDQGIITPQLTRKEAIEFKKQYKRSKRKIKLTKKQTPSQERAKLEKTRKKLYTELERIEARIAELSK